MSAGTGARGGGVPGEELGAARGGRRDPQARSEEPPARPRFVVTD